MVTTRHQVLEDSGILRCVVSQPFPKDTLDNSHLLLKDFQSWLAPLGVPCPPTLYQTISLSGSAFLEVEAPDEHLPEHMERALSGTKLKPKVSKSNMKI